MLDLPLRPKTIRVTLVQRDDGEDVVATLDTLSRRDLIEIGTQAAGAAEGGNISLASGLAYDICASHLVGIDGLTIGGEPFDPDNDEHVDALPLEWFGLMAQALFEYAQPTPELGKGGSPPDEPSPEG